MTDATKQQEEIVEWERPRIDRGKVPAIVAAAGEQAAEEFVAYFAASTWGASTQQVYLGALRRFFRWAEEKGLSLGEVAEGHVREFLDGLTESVRALTLGPLRGLFDRLASAGVVKESPIPRGKASSFAPTLGKLKAMLLGTDPGLDENCAEFRAGLVLLAGLFHGTGDLDALSNFTRIPLDQIEQYAARLREDGGTCCNWHKPDGDVEFWIHSLVALGEVKKLSVDRYATVRDGHEGEPG